MTTAMWISGSLSVLLALLTAFLGVRGHRTATLCGKTAASLCFCATALLALCAVAGDAVRVRFGAGILAALLLGLLGDVFLCLDGFLQEKCRLTLYAFGMTAFLLGHLVYIVLFLAEAPFRWPVLAAAALVPAGVILSVRAGMVAPPKKLLPLAFAYSGVIGLMLAACLGALLAGTPRGVPAFLAALGFVVSDSCLALHDYPARPGRPSATLNFAVMLFYYLAQVGFACTIVL